MPVPPMPESLSDAAGLPVEQLALILLRDRFSPPSSMGGSSRHNLLVASAWQPSQLQPQPPDQFLIAVAEAFAWLEAHALVAPYPPNLGRFNDAYFQTRLGQRVLATPDPIAHVRSTFSGSTTPADSDPAR